jgi:hypothetical protein
MFYVDGFLLEPFGFARYSYSKEQSKVAPRHQNRPYGKNSKTKKVL